jgi:alkanesulfonate monooxygenase SsuD/methylene tetrahydromethanopterin reductase-like flavin-dependent oxidoreductase (luciferase family)
MDDDATGQDTASQDGPGNDVQVGVLIPTGTAQLGGARPAELMNFATAAQDLGFDSLWVNDTLLSARVEALTMLAALAPATDRVLLGTAALLPVLRQPVQAAQALASIHLLSGGRLVVAVGAGFPGRFGQPLYELSGVPWPRRFARLDDTVALWRELWSGQNPESFRGQVLSLDRIPPGVLACPGGGPPVWLGGAAPAALDRTGRRYDGWLPYPPDPAEYRAGLDRVRASAAAAGRPAGAVTPALVVSVLITEAADGGRQAMSDYAAANYGLSLGELQAIQALVAGPPEDVAQYLGRYVDAGARHLVCRIAAPGLPGQHEQLARLAGLLPALRGARPGAPTDTPLRTG